MVKRCGKSAPRPWQHGWQAKPRTEQGQIGEHGGRTLFGAFRYLNGRPVHSFRVGCSIPPVMAGLEE